jgi:hypothetical protein
MVAGTHRVEHLLAAPDDVLGIGYGGVRRDIFQQSFEPLLALELRQSGDVLAVELEQVEGVEGDRFLAVERVFEEREVGAPMLVGGADLAVNQCGSPGQLGKRWNDVAELAGPVVAIAGIHAHLVAGDGSLSAIAVELHLEEPAVAGRDPSLEGGELEWTEGREDELGRFRVPTG